MRLSGLAPGAKLELVKSSSSSAAINVVLRTVDPVEQLSGVFPPNTSVWSILRKFEQDAKAAGRGNVNITERCLPSAAGNGSGRLLYQMPAVRVANRELANFDELRKSLEDLGCSGRELLVLRFLPTEVPYEDALMEIAGAPVHHSGAETQKVDLAETAPATEDVEMSNTSDTPGGPAESAESTESRDAPSDETAPSLPEEPAVPDVPKFAVYQPSSSQVPAAAALEVPDSAYDIGISDLKRIKQNYHNASLPQRLPSNKEIEEKEAILRQEMEKINTVGHSVSQAQISSS